jgi:methyl-accepting chemotaxis protein
MLAKMVPDIKHTSELIQEIATASNEQQAGAEGINTAIHQLDQVIQQIASASKKMSSTSEELSSQSEHLKDTVAYFKIDGGDYTSAPQTTIRNNKPALPPSSENSEFERY